MANGDIDMSTRRGLKIKNIEISLNNELAIYRPGEKIAGSVNLYLTTDAPVNAVRLWLHGVADTSWREINGNSSRGRFEYQRCLHECLPLFGKGLDEKPDGTEFLLKPGLHTYKFEYQLPQEIPTSFEVIRPYLARVRYLLKAQIDSSDRAMNQSREKNFIVLRPLDLNKDPAVMQGPVILTAQKSLGYLCCTAGSITCTVKLNKNGYVPGETMHIDVEILNQSSIDIVASAITFEQHVRLSAQGSTRSLSACIFSISSATIKPGDSGMYHDVIHIPPVPPSRLDGCKLIDLDYIVHVVIEPTSFYSKMEVDVPVTIGTDPLEGSFKNCVEVVPCYASFDYATGDIEEYDEDLANENKSRSVYRYYKTVHSTEIPVDLHNSSCNSTMTSNTNLSSR